MLRFYVNNGYLQCFRVLRANEQENEQGLFTSFLCVDTLHAKGNKLGMAKSPMLHDIIVT